MIVSGGSFSNLITVQGVDLLMIVSGEGGPTGDSVMEGSFSNLITVQGGGPTGDCVRGVLSQI